MNTFNYGNCTNFNRIGFQEQRSSQGMNALVQFTIDSQYDDFFCLTNFLHNRKWSITFLSPEKSEFYYNCPVKRKHTVWVCTVYTHQDICLHLLYKIIPNNIWDYPSFYEPIVSPNWLHYKRSS